MVDALTVSKVPLYLTDTKSPFMKTKYINLPFSRGTFRELFPRPLIKTTVVCLLIAEFLIALGYSQGTAFTFQGHLTSNGQPASGTFDLVFTLFPASNGGIAVVNPITNTATFVSNGEFTAVLDFGNPFNGSARWIEEAL